MPEQLKVEVDHTRLHRACDDLQLHNEDRYGAFEEKLTAAAAEFGTTPGELKKGISFGSIKKMRCNQMGWPRSLPYALVIILFRETGIDVSAHQAVQFFEELDFIINLQLDVPQRNDAPPEYDIHDLKNFAFTIHEADAIVTDEDDPSRELDIKIGYKQLRLSLSAPDIERQEGALLAEHGALRPCDEEGATLTGDFVIRYGGTSAPSWVFEHKEEGRLLSGTVASRETLGAIRCAPGANLVAELSAKANALKVRIVEEAGSRAVTAEQARAMRDKMKTALVRKVIEGAGEEFVIYHKRLAG